MRPLPPGVLRAVVPLVTTAAVLASLRAADPPPAPSPALSLPDLEALARTHNPTLVQAHAQVEAARGRAVQAGLYPNPTAGYYGQQIGNQGTAGQQGAFVSQMIVTGGKLRLNR